ncbi:hypothetical protein JOC86_001559 [Bacillus pakistanensis]|uniref:Lipoprotein n=1 Tax=Rossellomorea pakistanensis TaxID=992288 RepID=A0ABS2NAX9_9BACI|nr:hypothetical protein [Bacillus pakistanensis]MBM7585022.1 hypothetical protein [Bacillus pakistanensis]
MKKIYMTLMISVFFVLILSGCNNMTFDEHLGNIEKIVSESLDNPNGKTNEETERFKFHLPFGADIKEKKENNVIIEKGNNTFILFNNPNEEYDSETLYKSSTKDQTGIIKEKTFEQNNRFGYYIVREIKNDKYELTVGIGGIKMTTKSDRNDLSDAAEFMMDVISSVKYK